MPSHPKGDGIALFYAAIVLLALSWITCVLRAGVRIWRATLGLDDILMGIGLLLFSVTASLCIVCTFYGSGQLAKNLAPAEISKGTKLFFIAEFFYASCAVTIKCSIAVTLLRIASGRMVFVWALWTIMVATACSAIIFIIGVANICHPITTLWGETTTGSCNLKLNADVSFFFSAIEIATDWSLAILPAVLLWNVQMKVRVKSSVAVILGLGAFASCATIVRLRYLSLYSDPTEFMLATGKVGLWSIIEAGIGIIAGSMSALRPLLSRSTGSSDDKKSEATNPKKSRSAIIRMDTFKELVERDGDGDSQKYILKETQVTMQSDATKPGDWEARERSQVLGWKSGAEFQANAL